MTNSLRASVVRSAAVVLVLFAHAPSASGSIPVDHFSGMELESPLPSRVSTGDELRLSGQLEDRTHSKVYFRFLPESGDNTLSFYLNADDGRFARSVVADHAFAGTYTLDVFAGQEWDELAWLGTYSPVQIDRGEGVVHLPERYFEGVLLGRPMAASFRTGEELFVEGEVTDPGFTRLSFELVPTSAGERIKFFCDVEDGKVERSLVVDHTSAGEYTLELFGERGDAGWPFLRSYTPVRITPGSGAILLPERFFQGLLLDQPLPTDLPVGKVVDFTGTADPDIQSISIELTSVADAAARTIRVGIESNRFHFPLRLRPDELGALTFLVFGQFTDGTWSRRGVFTIHGTDPPAPDLEVGILALSLLSGGRGSIPLSNRGEAALTLSAPSTVGPFEVAAAPASIPPGGSAEVVVEYRGSGGEHGSLTLISSDPVRPEVTVALQGLAPTEQGPDLQHVRADADGLVSLPLDFSEQEYVLALYSGQVAGRDPDAVYDFSVGGPAPGAARVVSHSAMSQRDRLDMHLRQQEREIAARIRELGRRAAKPVQVQYQVGDQRSFVFSEFTNVPEQTIEATVVAVNERTVAFVQTDLRREETTLTTPDIQVIIDQFQEDYDFLVGSLGAPSDVDGDGKIAFLFTHLVGDIENESGVGMSRVGGFYNAASAVPEEAWGNGNLTDMIYFKATDWGTDPRGYRGFLAHEFQHLINFNQHVLVRAGAGEVSWLNEGLSHVAEDLVASSATAFLARAFLEDPSWGLQGDASFNRPRRGAAYLFVRSLVDRLGPEVLLRLIQTGLADRENVEEATGERFEELLAFWAAQLYATGNHLIDHPRLNYSFGSLQTSEGRGVPLPVSLIHRAGGAPTAGTLRPRGVNYVRLSGAGTATVTLHSDPAAKLGAVVLPVPRDFVPPLQVPRNFSPDLLLDRPLPGHFSTGDEVFVEGDVTDPTLSRLSFELVPVSEGERLKFFCDVEDGRFALSILLGHASAGTYELEVFGERVEDYWPWLGSFSPIQIDRGEGVVSLPARYFDGLHLDRPLATRFRTGDEVVLGGELDDRALDRVYFRFISDSEEDTLRLYCHAENGRFARSVVIDHASADTYRLEVFAGQQGQSNWPLVGRFWPLQIDRGEGVVHLPELYFQGLLLDEPMRTRWRTGEELFVEGEVTDPAYTRLSFEFVPTSGGERQKFFCNVHDGRFSRSIVLDHVSPGDYSLEVYGRRGDGDWPFLRSYAPVRITPGSGSIVLPERFFEGVLLDRPLPTRLQADAEVLINGIFEEPLFNQVLVRLISGSRADTLRFFADVEDNRFAFPVVAQVAGKYEVDIWARQSDQTYSYMDRYSRLVVVPGGTSLPPLSEGSIQITLSCPERLHAETALEVSLDLILHGIEDRLGAFDATLTWDPELLGFVDVRPGAFGPITHDAGLVERGELALTAFNPQGVTGSTQLAILTLRSVGPGNRVGRLDARFSQLAATDATGFRDLLPALQVSPCAATVVLESHDSSAPAAFSLDQSYPNPFNSSTVIRYSLATTGHVGLSVYNLAGQQVATLADGVRMAGQYSVNWDGSDDASNPLASGIYLYRLETDTYEEARKLLLLR